MEVVTIRAGVQVDGADKVSGVGAQLLAVLGATAATIGLKTAGLVSHLIIIRRY